MASMVGKLLGLSVDEKILPVDEEGAYDDASADDKFALVHIPKLRPEARCRLGELALEPLEASLLEMDDKKSWRALDFHNWIWEYAAGGDVQSAVRVAAGGLGDVDMRDEIYAQLMVCARAPDAPKFVARCWHLVCACVMTFPPSDVLANYVFHFLRERGSANRAAGNYAAFSAVALAGVLEAGAAYAATPSAVDLAAYGKREPVVVRVERVDGVAITEALPLPPHVNCGRVAEILGGLFLELKDDRASTFGLVLCVGDGEARPLGPGEFLGDVLAGLDDDAFRLVFRRVVTYEGEPRNASDEAFEVLNYLECEDAAINEGSLAFPRATENALAALALRVSLGDDAPEAAEALADLDIGLELREFFPPARALDAAADLAAAVAPDLASFRGRAPRELRRDFVDRVKGHALYGAHVFRCGLAADDAQGADALALAAALPDEYVRVAVNARGVSLLDARDASKTHRFFPRNAVRSWERPAPDRVLLRVADDHVALTTPNAPGLVAALRAYVAHVSPTPVTPRTPRSLPQ